MTAFNTTTIPYQHERKSQGVLYLPSIVLGTCLIVLLAISFWRYHRKTADKRKHSRNYALENLNVKRPRISGYISANAASHAICQNGVFSLDTSVSLYANAFDLGSLDQGPPNTPDQYNVNIYDMKPRTPVSYFDRNPQTRESDFNIVRDSRVNDARNIQSTSRDQEGPKEKQQSHVRLSDNSLNSGHHQNVRTNIPSISLNESLKVNRGNDNKAYYSENEGIHLSVRPSTGGEIEEIEKDAFHDLENRRPESKRKKKKRDQVEPRRSPVLFHPVNMRMGIIDLYEEDDK